MKRRRTVQTLALVAALATIVAIALFHAPSPEQTSTQPSPSTRPFPSQVETDRGFASEMPNPSPRREDRDSELDAMDGEAILTFASVEALEAFLDAASERGITPLATSRTLRSVRLRLSPQALRSLRRGIGSDAQWDSNYTLLAPLPVDPRLTYGQRGFADTALRFLGARADSTDAGDGLTVAVLDSGVLSHSTLEGAALDHLDLLDPAVAAVGQGSASGHGTAVASLIAGQDGNGIAPGAKLLSIRILDSDGIGDTFSLARGIVEAVDRGAQVVNMSLGSFGSNAALDNAIDYAHSKGVVLVASAGNDGVKALPYPAAYDKVIAVSAIDANGQATRFANQGPAVDIAAPGVGVYAAWDQDGWVSFTGTSASTPFVSGAIAALSSELDLAPAEAAQLLMQRANDTGPPGRDSLTGVGTLNLDRALNANTRGIYDLALADIFLDPVPDAFGKYAVHLTAQNRGTEPLSTASIEFTLPNGVTQSVYLGPLNPGQSAGHALSLEATELLGEQGYRIESRATTQSSDAKTDNDSRDATLSLAPPEP